MCQAGKDGDEARGKKTQTPDWWQVCIGDAKVCSQQLRKLWVAQVCFTY